MTTWTRRGFLGAAGGLVIGFALPIPRRPYLAEAEAAIATAAVLRRSPLPPDRSRRQRDGARESLEMGQGIWTTLADADRRGARGRLVEDSGSSTRRPVVFAHTQGRGQRTGGSSTTRSELDRLRQVGATARSMLIEAAARRWRVPAERLRAESAMSSAPRPAVVRPARRRRRQAHTAGQGRAQDPASWKIIGTPGRGSTAAEKITGRARFGMDVQLPGLLTALVRRSPTFGGQVKAFAPRRRSACPASARSSACRRAWR